MMMMMMIMENVDNFLNAIEILVLPCKEEHTTVQNLANSLLITR
jgi:hypothetical protein